MDTSLPFLGKLTTTGEVLVLIHDVEEWRASKVCAGQYVAVGLERSTRAVKDVTMVTPRDRLVRYHSLSCLFINKTKRNGGEKSERDLHRLQSTVGIDDNGRTRPRIETTAPIHAPALAHSRQTEVVQDVLHTHPMNHLCHRHNFFGILYGERQNAVVGDAYLNEVLESSDALTEPVSPSDPVVQIDGRGFDGDAGVNQSGLLQSFDIGTIGQTPSIGHQLHLQSETSPVLNQKILRHH